MKNNKLKTMKRSELSPMPVYFDRYINKCDDVELLEAIQTSIDELPLLPVQELKAVEDRVYAPGKWTVKDILQHLIDAERIFMYRALAFARGEEQALPPFEEDEYAESANANQRRIECLMDELRLSHLSFKAMFSSFTPEMLRRVGRGFKGEYSVASIGFCVPGHQRWHFEIIREKYLPLVKQEAAVSGH
jgi:DinB superfamily